MHKISIITINFNNKAGLDKTINSAASQTFTDYEYIVIDGGSIDGSIDVINKYADKITLWTSEKDKGIYDAMNKGISKATGEYCYFLNSGDYFYSNNVLRNVFKNNPSEDILYGDVIIEKNGNIEGQKIHPDTLSNYYLLTQVIAHQAQFIKRSLFQKFGNYNLQYKIVSDYELFVRMLLKYKVTAKHFPVYIAVFDLSGLSNDVTQLKLINAERNMVLEIYFPKVLVRMYRGYTKLLHSKMYKNPMIASVVTMFRNIVFKFIKPKS